MWEPRPHLRNQFLGTSHQIEIGNTMLCNNMCFVGWQETRERTGNVEPRSRETDTHAHSRIHPSIHPSNGTHKKRGRQTVTKTVTETVPDHGQSSFKLFTTIETHLNSLQTSLIQACMFDESRIFQHLQHMWCGLTNIQLQRRFFCVSIESTRMKLSNEIGSTHPKH